MEGRLFRYRTSPGALQAFESPARHAHRRFCIMVGGLTDGLLACSYVEALGAALDARGWSLVQPVLSSSYAGYGCSSLETDAGELCELLQYLATEREAAAFAIVGHSTGCQDACELLAAAPPSLRAMIRAAVLQAPVSDREAASLEASAESDAMLAEAKALVARGEGSALLSSKHYGFVPMSAERYASLVTACGPDDVFSSDLSAEYLAARLAHMGTAGQRAGRVGAPDGAAWERRTIEPVPDHPGLRTLFVHSGADEYVPPSVDVASLSSRFVAAAGGASNGAAALTIARGSHNLATPPEAAGEFVEAVAALLEQAAA